MVCSWRDERLPDIADELREYATTVEAEYFDGRDAARLAGVAAEIERLGAALRLLFGQRAVATSGWVHGTNATRPEEWYARLAGISDHRAVKDLQIADRLKECSKTEEKLRDGSLSRDQAERVTSAAASDPEAESKLLDVIEQGGGMRRLQEEHDRAVAAATDMKRAREKAHRERHLRTWVDGAATRGSFSDPTDDVAYWVGSRQVVLGATPSLRAQTRRLRRNSRGARGSPPSTPPERSAHVPSQVPSSGASRVENGVPGPRSARVTAEGRLV